MSWTTSSVAELADVAIGPFGSSMKAASYVEDGLPVVAGGHLGDLRNPNLTGADRISEATSTRLARSVLRPGDLVFPHRGAIGRVGLVAERSMMSTSMMRARFNREKVDPEFAYWYFKAEGCSQLLTMASSVGTPGIGQPLASLKSVLINFPPLTEQRAIADLLGALDDKIAANRLVAELGAKWIRARWGQIAYGSNKTVRWSDVADVNPSTPTSRGSEVSFLDMKNLPQYGLLAERWERRQPGSGTRFMNGDVLLARITPCFENGKLGVVDFLEPGEVGYGSTEFIVYRPRKSVPTAALFCVISDADFRAEAAMSMTGTSGRQRVDAKALADYELSWPSPTELAQFGTVTDSLLARISAARDENQLLARTRDELLPLLMSGKITVKQAETQVEEVV